MRLAPIAAIVLTAAPALSQEAIHFPDKLDMPGYQAVIADAGPLYIAGQPSEAALRDVIASGVRTVINLRTQPEMDNRKAVPFDEAALLDELGVTYVHIPLGGPDTPYTPEAVDKFATAFESADTKVLLHCTIAWRASHLWAAYLVKYKGYSLEDAIHEADAINLNGYRGPGKQPIEGFLALPEKPAGVR
ncbi:MAG: sulfur transferase domain-containing protein [Hyphomonadaceae bacterium]